MLEDKQHIHFVGIGGIGMSALAHVLLDQGFVVSGSDRDASAITDVLEKRGTRIYLGHAPENVTGADLVVVTSALKADNPELVRARESGLDVVKRAELLGSLVNQSKGVAVAGTHGKTTTSSLISFILDRAGLDPTVLVGGIIPQLGRNGRYGRGEYLVAEADEYDGSFLRLRPFVAVVTNIEADHLDYYADLEAIREAFKRFLSSVKPNGLMVLCADDPVTAKLAVEIWPELGSRSSSPTILTYGLKEEADWQAVELAANGRGGSDFMAVFRGTRRGEFSLSVPGVHNVCNSLAAIAVAVELGVPMPILQESLQDFQGAQRRFEVKGTAKGIVVVDDYGHHPTEIKATLAAARLRFPGRPIWCAFQPHTYSRTKALLDDFARAFGDADHVAILDVYAAREAEGQGIDSVALARAIVHPDVSYVGSLREGAEYLLSRLQPGGVLMTVGAGSVWKLGDELLQALKDES